MEKEIDIAKILKNAPIGTKLYSPLFGNVFLKYIGELFITVRHHGTTANFYHNGRLYNYEGTEPMLYPSKEMRDWNKFAWKRGDVLVNNSGFKVLFDKWANTIYTGFYAKIVNLGDSSYYDTDRYTLAPEDEAKSYIKIIEDKHEGKLNLETLEIEKQNEFKDGDVVAFGESVAIYKKLENDELYFYACIEAAWGLILSDSVNTSLEYRLATDSEKHQLFEALAKENKAWDAEKKAIVDLPKKCEFKPMDWCLMRDIRGEECFAWSLCQFAYQLESGRYEAVGGMRFDECIPYNEETAHLLGTTDDWGK